MLLVPPVPPHETIERLPAMSLPHLPRPPVLCHRVRNVSACRHKRLLPRRYPYRSSHVTRSSENYFPIFSFYISFQMDSMLLGEGSATMLKSFRFRCCFKNVNKKEPYLKSPQAWSQCFQQPLLWSWDLSLNMNAICLLGCLEAF